MFSAAKLFFAYGLGNALTFPMAVGATAVLMAERPTPAAVFRRLREHRPTIFYGVPTLYAALLASPDAAARAADVALRVCTSAGEALPRAHRQALARTSASTSSTASARPRCCTSSCRTVPATCATARPASPVPGYELRVVDDDGAPVRARRDRRAADQRPDRARSLLEQPREDAGDLPGAVDAQRRQVHASIADGYYTYAGRTDDMLKVGGIYVSPFEVEAALIDARGGARGGGGRPRRRTTAWSSRRPTSCCKAGRAGRDALADELQQHVKIALAPYKYPRWIEFVPELPKTATGKIQRFKLRARQRLKDGRAVRQRQPKQSRP